MAGELVGVDPPIDGQVHGRGLQVLAHREDVATGLHEVVHRGFDLVRSFAHPQDEVGLRDHARVEACGDPKHVEGTVVPEGRTDPGVQPADGLEVVGEHVGCGVEHGRDVGLATFEIARQDLDAAAGDLAPDRADARCPDPRPAVREVVTSDAGQHDVAQAHGADRVGDALGLAFVDRVGLGGHHVAEAAASGALRAQDQERGLPVFPALVDVGAHRFFAHGVELAPAHDVSELPVVGPGLEPDLQPRRLPFTPGVHAGLLGVDAGAVRDADDRQMEPPAGGVVVALGHGPRV